MRKKKETESFLTLDSFGSAKNYWAAWVASRLGNYPFAHSLSRSFSRNGSFIGNISIPFSGDELLFPVYSTCFNDEFSVFLTVVSNKTNLSPQTSSKLDNPLFGGLLFEDEYHIFNNEGLAKVESSFSGADYILLLSADNCFDQDEYVKEICASDCFRIILSGTPESVSASQKKRKAFLDFLQFLFYETESMTAEFRYKKLRSALHQRMSVSEKNYEKLKYPVEDTRTITSPYLRREDF